MSKIPRIGRALNPKRRIGRRPQVSAVRPTQGDSSAVMICGPTMHAAMTSPASLPARFVTAPAAIGSIAALAR